MPAGHPQRLGNPNHNVRTRLHLATLVAPDGLGSGGDLHSKVELA
jgi:hypothetical protein